MCHVVSRRTVDACGELKQGVQRHENARRNGDRDKQQEHPHFGEQPTEGEEQTEDGTGCTDGDAHGMTEGEHPHQLLHDGRTHARHHVVGEEAIGAPLLFDRRTEHQHGEHVAEHVPEICMQKHVGERLPDMERIDSAKRGGIPVDEPQPTLQIEPHARENRPDEPYQKVNQQQVLCNGRQLPEKTISSILYTHNFYAFIHELVCKIRTKC